MDKFIGKQNLSKLTQDENRKPKQIWNDLKKLTPFKTLSQRNSVSKDFTGEFSQTLKEKIKSILYQIL